MRRVCLCPFGLPACRRIGKSDATRPGSQIPDNTKQRQLARLLNYLPAGGNLGVKIVTEARLLAAPAENASLENSIPENIQTSAVDGEIG